MKTLFIVANWKSNKTESESNSWLQGLKIKDLRLTNKEIIICPSFTAFPILKSLIISHKSSIKLGAQNVSPFDEGAYTGEISAKQIKELAGYVIVGHSERRRNFGEDENMINQKIEQSLKHELIPILCVSDIKQVHNSKFMIHNSNCIIAYEPLSAIGTGYPDTPENADSIALKIKKELGESPVLYGGSVTSKNVKDFTSMPNIDGVLVGGASLDPLEFLKIIKNA
jgi:triosephosphate isomerase